ncbi:phosphatase PAP2 family protein [Arcobacter porcinus]|uniref:Phosphoesterase n=1 Tax=Arcobacter porcinus TaxID=1935204 RepID=A0A5C2HFB9_9BACT|nr:phosphatase PAP2 family protein [Arcobacter porcinus]OCL97367.1 PAP2 superfamily protein [Aliarcobacter thereius]QEP41623.1 phosphoesterase [Arcobacter porcinus]
MTQERLNKQIIITTILLIVVISIFELTNIDMIFQSYLYDPSNNSWLIDEKYAPLYILFYSGFKTIFIVFSILIILITLFLKKNVLVKTYKNGLVILSLSLIFVPSLALLKNITNMPCPFNVIEFGGKYPEIKLFESYPEELTPQSTLKCYPAGHATMGFSLMALYFLFKTPRNKNIALTFGIIIGILTGGYKILIGDHFLSHTLITMILAWLTILIISKLTKN